MKRRKRRLKPKMLLLSGASERSIARVAAAIAFTSQGEIPSDHKLRNRAVEMLDLLRRMA